jgi:hypothetical protein
LHTLQDAESHLDSGERGGGGGGYEQAAGVGLDSFAEEDEEDTGGGSAGTPATSMQRACQALAEHQVTTAGSVYYFNAPHRGSDPTLAALKARETEIDRRATAVVAHQQLRRCVEQLAPDQVSRELEAIDPMRLLDLGVAPDQSLGLYRALYTYTQRCHDRIASALAPVGEEARNDVLHDVWAIFGAVFEARAGVSFPSQVVHAQGLTADLSCMTEAVNSLAQELSGAIAELATSRAESDTRLEELIELRPLCGAAKEQRARAEKAERERDSWQRRAERLKAEAAATALDAAAGWLAAAETRAAGEASSVMLLAETRRVEVEADAQFASAETAWAAERAAMVAELEGNREVVAEAERSTKLNKNNTGTLKADIAFLREKLAELELAKKAAEDRCVAAEDSEEIALTARDAAEAAYSELQVRTQELEKNLKDQTSRAEGVTARLTLTTMHLATANARIEALDKSSQLEQALAEALEHLKAETKRKDCETARADVAEAALVEMRELIATMASKNAEEGARAVTAESRALEMELTIAEVRGENTRLVEEAAAAASRIRALEARAAKIEGELGSTSEEVARERGRAEAALTTVARMAAAGATAGVTAEAGFERILVGNGVGIPATAVAASAGDVIIPGGDRTAAAAAAAFAVEDRRWSEVSSDVSDIVSASSDQLDRVFDGVDQWSLASLALAQSAVAKATAAANDLAKTRTELGATRAALEATQAALETTQFSLQASETELENMRAEGFPDRIIVFEAEVARLNDELDYCRSTLAETEARSKRERAGRMLLQFTGSSARVSSNKHRVDAETFAAVAEKSAADAQAGRARELELRQDVAAMAGVVDQHVASRASAHAAHATTKIRLGIMKASGLSLDGASRLVAAQPIVSPRASSRCQEWHDRGTQTDSSPPPIDQGGPRPWLQEAQIMASTPEDIVAYQEKLLEEYEDASLSLKMNQPQSPELYRAWGSGGSHRQSPRRAQTEHGFDPAQMGHMGQR